MDCPHVYRAIMFVQLSGMFWLLFLTLLVVFPSEFLCLENHAHVVSYERTFLYQLDTEATKLKPAGLPEWVPLRGDKQTDERSVTRRRGKKGGVRQKVRLRKYKPALPTITLSNVRSIGNKIDELRGKVRYDNEFRNSGIIGLTETWLNPSMPSQVFDILGFDMI